MICATLSPRSLSALRAWNTSASELPPLSFQFDVQQVVVIQLRIEHHGSSVETACTILADWRRLSRLVFEREDAATLGSDEHRVYFEVDPVCDDAGAIAQLQPVQHQRPARAHGWRRDLQHRIVQHDAGLRRKLLRNLVTRQADCGPLLDTLR
jgi:hypothetical protein